MLHRQRVVAWLTIPLIVGLVSVAATSSGAASAATPVAPSPASRVVPVEQSPVAGGVRHPLQLRVRVDAAGKTTITNPTPTGNKPAQMRTYLGLTGTGSGQTIAIVSAYDAPSASADLATFNKTFGLPSPPSFRKVDASGGTRYPAANPGWALETALDVQWAHAIAPAASILLVEAKSSALSDMFVALDYAAKQPGVTVISNSWGVSSEFSTEAGQDAHCALSTAACVVASGDNGNPGGYPAYNPYALAVGGTTLNLASDSSVLSESAWSGSGGGVSAFETKPSYQASTTFARRSIPDVSYDGDPATGVPVYSSTTYQQQSGWFQMGGTSIGAPQWSGIIAAANQLRKANGKASLVATRSSGFPLHSALYGAASGTLFDVTVGSNGTCGAICTTAPGYDAVTGLGAPRTGVDASLAAAP